VSNGGWYDRARALDAWPWRAAERIRRLGQTARRSVLKWRRRATTSWRLRAAGAGTAASLHPVAREMAALRAASPGGVGPRDLGAQVETLRVALAAGAYGAASELSREVWARIGEIEPRHRPRALVLVLETLLAHGDREQAATVAAAHRAELERSSQGLSLLVTLHDRDAQQRLQLPDGRLNALGLSQRIEERVLGGAELDRLLGEQRVALLRNPELHLLATMAYRETDPGRATMALGRFLRAHGLSRCAVEGTWSGRLRDLRFRPVPGTRRGPLVSVVLAAHDAAGTIEYAVDSILAQTYRDIEVLLGDDGSSDGRSSW